MDLKNILLTMAKSRKVSLTEIAMRIGISRQALYHRLDHKMSAESFIEIVSAMGGEVCVSFDGSAKKLSKWQ